MKDKDIDFSEFSPLSKAEWKEKVLKDLKGKDYESLVWETDSGFSLEPYYTAEEVGRSTGNPGEFPYLRSADGQSRQWEICQEIFEKDFKKANKTAISALMGGATALKFHAEAATEKDLELLLKDVVMDVAPLYLNPGANPVKLTNALLKTAANRSVDASKLRGAINYNPLGELAEFGSWSAHNATGKLKSLSDLGKEHFSLFRLIDADSTLFHEAGATTVQEIAITLSMGNEYIELLKQEGESIDDISALLQFTMATGTSYFTEIAKLRAFRPLWATVVNAHKPAHECSAHGFVFSRSSQRHLAVPDAYNNLIRATSSAMSAVFGGANAISVLPFDHLFDEENPFSLRMSRNLQNILAEESFFNEVIDPAGGSYYIEKLTDELKKGAWKLFQEIESEGGFVAALKSGMIQSEVKKSAVELNEKIDRQERIVVGVNKYFNEDDEDRKAFVKEQTAAGGEVEPIQRLWPVLKEKLEESRTQKNESA